MIKKLPMTHESELRSQKARGIRALAGSSRSEAKECTKTLLLQDELTELDEFVMRSAFDNYPVFVRPCPSKPRPGFVDSCVCYSAQAVREVIQNIVEKAPEEQIECVVMKPIDAEYSGIISRSGLALGPGHNGATAGKSIYVPFECDEKTFQAIAGITGDRWDSAHVEGDPHIEFVRGKDSVLRYVQLRGGPKAPSTRVFAPSVMKIKHVRVLEDEPLFVNDDTIGWESYCKEGFDDGTVFWLKSASPSSHYALHLLANNVPFVLGEPAPHEGDVLEPQNEQRDESDYKQIAFVATREVKHEMFSQAMRLGFSVLHGYTQIGRTPAANIVIGRAVAYTVRMAAACCIGETRHGRANVKKGWKLPAWYDGTTFNCDRVQVYRQAFGLNMSELYGYMEACVKIFGMKWQSSYGGPKWQTCAETTRDTIKCVLDFAYEPGKATWDALLGKWNALVNCVHNGGPLLNKVLSTSVMHEASVKPQYVFQQKEVFDLLWEDPLVQACIEKSECQEYKMTLKTKNAFLKHAKDFTKTLRKKKTPVKKIVLPTYGSVQGQVRMPSPSQVRVQWKSKYGQREHTFSHGLEMPNFGMYEHTESSLVSGSAVKYVKCAIEFDRHPITKAYVVRIVLPDGKTALLSPNDEMVKQLRIEACTEVVNGDESEFEFVEQE